MEKYGHDGINRRRNNTMHYGPSYPFGGCLFIDVVQADIGLKKAVSHQNSLSCSTRIYCCDIEG